MEIIVKIIPAFFTLIFLFVNKKDTVTIHEKKHDIFSFTFPVYLLSILQTIKAQNPDRTANYSHHPIQE